MAVLTDTARENEWQEFMSWVSSRGEEVAASNTVVRQVFNDLDDFFNTNAPAINSAISLPGRSEVSTAHKAYIAARVLLRRYADGA